MSLLLEALKRAEDRGLDRAVVPHVGLARLAVPAGRLDLLHDPVEVRRRPGGHADLGALAGEAQGDGAADAAGAARDEDAEGLAHGRAAESTGGNPRAAAPGPPPDRAPGG